MNWSQWAGICRQYAEGMNGAWDNLIECPMRTADGRRGQIDKKAHQRREIAKQESARQMKDFLHRNRNWNC